MPEQARTPVGERTTQTSLVAKRDWSLWLDWCTATGRDPHDLDGPALAVFLRELPATTLVERLKGQPLLPMARAWMQAVEAKIDPNAPETLTLFE